MAESSTAAQFAKAKVTAAQIGKVRAAFDPKWKDVVTKLRAAIKAKQNDKIDLYLAALDGRIKELNKILRAATISRGELREIEMDEDFVAANLAEVEKAVTAVSDAVEGLTAEFDEGKTLQNEAEAASASFCSVLPSSNCSVKPSTASLTVVTAFSTSARFSATKSSSVSTSRNSPRTSVAARSALFSSLIRPSSAAR